MTSRQAGPEAPARASASVPGTGAATQDAGNGLAQIIETVLGGDLPVAVECFDGSRAGSDDAAATIQVRSPRLLRRLLSAPGELGLGRGYVTGELDVVGDIYTALQLLKRPMSIRRLSAAQWRTLLQLLRSAGLRPLPPPQEARLRGRPHSKHRDAAAIAHHYDVSNDFYRLLLGPSMTYSCGVWPEVGTSLEQAQAAKYELVSRKLGLRPGMRLLDVGCGWGGMLLHAARRHGVHGVGVTVSARQAEWARRAVAEAGLTDRVEIRLQDYRDVTDGPYDAISSIGMFEHVGLAHLGEYFRNLNALLAPGGRLLNHGIDRPPGHGPRLDRRGFINRYVFPDGELHELGSVISQLQAAGFEVRHVESLREHYARTLRAWVANLERRWPNAVNLVGPARARIWRVYLGGSALGFEAGGINVHQVLAVPAVPGPSGLPPRPNWDSTPLAEPLGPPLPASR